MMQIPPLLFNQQFSRFDRKVRLKSGRRFTSFREELPEEEEGYKERLRNEARYRLDIPSWKSSDIGKGRILERVVHAIEVHEPRRGIKNNLVDWPNRYGHKYRSHRAILDARSDRPARRALEKWFFDFFKTSKSDEKAFESFRSLVGNRYDIVAYLFFLKDWNRFMPIAPETFDEAFRLLGLNLVTSGHCSWPNYAQYNDRLMAVREALRETLGISDARLIDAHSFCWMLIRLEGSVPSSEVVIPLPQAIGSVDEVVIQESEIIEDGPFDSVDEEKFLEQQKKQRQLGKLAQEVALQSERKRLAKLGYLNPNAVEPVWKEWTRGYDILSREVDGRARHIEVKSARKSRKRLSFFVTAHEWKVSRKLPNYYFYLVTDAGSSKPTVLTIKAQQLREQHLRPASYFAAFAASF
jgi:hypothetical protein